jgi:hypothetical protein
MRWEREHGQDMVEREDPMWSKRWLNLLTLLCVACVVSACGSVAQTDLTFYSDTRFQVITTISVPSRLLALAGGEAAVKLQLDQTIAGAQVSGAQAKWRHGKSSSGDQSVYVIEINGQGYGPPLSDNFDVQPVDMDGQPALKVTVVPGAQLISGGLGASTLTVHGGQILETNGTQTGKDTVTFGQLSVLSSGGIPYVILRPKAGLKAGFPWLYVGIGVGALALLGLIAFLIFRPRQKKGYAGKVFCPHCGAALARGTRICIRCRRPLPSR